MSKQGIIYEIVCNLTGERYVGSTFEPTVARRMATHIQSKNGCTSKIIILRGDYYSDLLETIHVDTRIELLMHERLWYDKVTCINKNRPYVSKEEKLEYQRDYQRTHYKKYYEQRRSQKKEYYIKNRDRQLAYQKQYVALKKQIAQIKNLNSAEIL